MKEQRFCGPVCYPTLGSKAGALGRSFISNCPSTGPSLSLGNWATCHTQSLHAASPAHQPLEVCPHCFYFRPMQRAS